MPLLSLARRVTPLLFVSFLACSAKNHEVFSEDAPVTLDVIEEIRSEQTLSLRALLESKVSTAPDVTVLLRTLNKDEVVGEALYPIKQKVFPYEFTISASAKDMTDYQLGLFWGDEAKQFNLDQPEQVKSPTIPDLTIEDVSTHPLSLQCRAGSCEGGLEISGILRGRGKNITISVVLVDPEGEEITEPALTELGELEVNGEAPFELGVDLPSGVSGHDLSAKVTIVDFTP